MAFKIFCKPYMTLLLVIRKIKVVVVNERKVVPYDVLVLTCGRQFIRPDCPNPEIQDEKMDKFQETTSRPDGGRHHHRSTHGPKVLK
jgi:hypothetical protein